MRERNFHDLLKKRGRDYNSLGTCSESVRKCLIWTCWLMVIMVMIVAVWTGSVPAACMPSPRA